MDVYSPKCRNNRCFSFDPSPYLNPSYKCCWSPPLPPKKRRGSPELHHQRAPPIGSPPDLGIWSQSREVGLNHQTCVFLIFLPLTFGYIWVDYSSPEVVSEMPIRMGNYTSQNGDFLMGFNGITIKLGNNPSIPKWQFQLGEMFWNHGSLGYPYFKQPKWPQMSSRKVWAV